MPYTVPLPAEGVLPPLATGHIVAGYAATVSRLPLQEGGGYMAVVPALPGCMSDGPTEDEACIALHDAVLQWIETAKAMGRLIPPPDALTHGEKLV